MKKLFLLSFAAILTCGAFAQTTTPTTTSVDKKQDMKDLRTDIRDKRQDKRQRRKDLAAGNKLAAKSMTQDIKAENKDIKADSKDLKADGVKHPVKRADRQIRRQNHRRH